MCGVPLCWVGVLHVESWSLLSVCMSVGLHVNFWYMFSECNFFFFLNNFSVSIHFLMFPCLQIKVANALKEISSWSIIVTWIVSDRWSNGAETLLWICSFCFLPSLRWKGSMELSVHVGTSMALTTAPLAHVYNYIAAKQLAVVKGNRWCQ